MKVRATNCEGDWGILEISRVGHRVPDFSYPRSSLHEMHQLATPDTPKNNSQVIYPPHSFQTLQRSNSQFYAKNQHGSHPPIQRGPKPTPQKPTLQRPSSTFQIPAPLHSHTGRIRSQDGKATVHRQNHCVAKISRLGDLALAGFMGCEGDALTTGTCE